MYILVTLSMLHPADWVEFSPYEIGMAKYGTFMTPDLFGSKFFMGTVVKKYEENPLHFLMGEEDVFIRNAEYRPTVRIVVCTILQHRLCCRKCCC